MKNIYFAILFIVILIFSDTYSQPKNGSSFYSAGHDSLLFDGADEISGNYREPAKDCLMKALAVRTL